MTMNILGSSPVRVGRARRLRAVAEAVKNVVFTARLSKKGAKWRLRRERNQPVVFVERQRDIAGIGQGQR